jgi:hypothetical protein
MWHSLAANAAPGSDTNMVVMGMLREPIRPIPQSLPLGAAKVSLGHELFELGRELPPKDLQQIVLFLKRLTGEHHGKPLP